MEPLVSCAIPKPYLLLIGDARDAARAKTAFGLRDWAPEACLGQHRFDPAAVDLGLPDMTPEEAARAGARTLVIGITTPGGQLPPAWFDVIVRAARAGLHIASGMHQRLDEEPQIARAVAEAGVKVHSVRHSDRQFSVGSGERRSGRRLLTVGTDCALGKKYTALALARAMAARGLDARFRATGQTGILIAGEGVAIDAVVADFISGAAEALSPAAAPGHWDIIEGQGSLFHPSFAGVTLGLVHGSQPDAMVLCHDPTRRTIRGLAHAPMPSLEEAIRAYVAAARLTNPRARVVGVSLNTSALTSPEALAVLERTGRDLGLPCVDPMRTGVEAIVDRLEPAHAA
jgi:uncharacterized NAD-dependent epimerase/dehydratase family protein